MSCKSWKEDWVAHLYDELDPEEEESLQAHLGECEECTRRLDELSASRRLLREACPEVPATPSVVVLGPRRIARPLWSFAAGAACATLIFGVGLLAGYRLPGAAPPQREALAAAQPAAVGSPPAVQPATLTQEQMQARLEPLLQRIDTLETGLAACGSDRPDDQWLTRAQFNDEIDRLERRADLKRTRDLEFLLAEITATEVRTGSYLNQTREALQMVAMRSDPRLTER
jgi:hypothetical protein